MGYGYRLHYSNPDGLDAAGYGKVSHLPCIFDARPGYHRLSSRFLIDRGLGLWDPVHRGKGPKSIPPTPVSIRSFGQWLCNFLEWSDVRGVNPLTCDYAEHVGGRYQREMVKGIWSHAGRKLAPKTVNLRVEQACEYLMWLTDKGYREPFLVPIRVVRVKGRSATSSVGHKSRAVESRQGRLRVPKRRLRMPKDDEVRAWLDRVVAKYGEARGLMAELILQTAVRREEAACWRVDTLPTDPLAWHIVNGDAPHHEQVVLVDISYGCKGGYFGEDHGDKIGPQGTIRVPLPFAERLHKYWKNGRNEALKKWVHRGRTASAQKQRAANAVHLFLDEETGERIKAKSLYNAWTGVDLPFKGWSPHLGRDWWSCSVLMIELRKHEHLLKVGPGYSSRLARVRRGGRDPSADPASTEARQ